MHKRSLRPTLAPALVLALLLSAGCLPYSMGSTAQPVREGELLRTTSAGFVIGGGGRLDDSSGTGSLNVPSSDQELRFGLSDRSDVGLRVVSGSGLVLNYKRRHAGAADPDSAAFATMWGAGIVNFGQHAYVEGSLMLSGRRRGNVLPYGGIKAFHVIPLDPSSLSDKPSVGAAFGLRLGTWDRGVSPELAIYYDEPVLGTRQGNLVVVPTVTLNGISFLPRIFR